MYPRSDAISSNTIQITSWSIANGGMSACLFFSCLVDVFVCLSVCLFGFVLIWFDLTWFDLFLKESEKKPNNLKLNAFQAENRPESKNKKQTKQQHQQQRQQQQQQPYTIYLMH